MMRQSCGARGMMSEIGCGGRGERGGGCEGDVQRCGGNTNGEKTEAHRNIGPIFLSFESTTTTTTCLTFLQYSTLLTAPTRLYSTMVTFLHFY